MQNDGEYQKSYDKSQEASDSIDKTTTDLFYKLMNLRINKAKNDADKSIKEINQLGASKIINLRQNMTKPLDILTKAIIL